MAAVINLVVDAAGVGENNLEVVYALDLAKPELRVGGSAHEPVSVLNSFSAVPGGSPVCGVSCRNVPVCSGIRCGESTLISSVPFPSVVEH